jgi:hypothetical protein
MAIDDVSDLSRRVQYTSGAGQTTFTYPFRIFDEGDLDVYVGDVQYTLGTMYSVTGVDNDLGGSVIFTTGLSAGDIVTIYSDTAIDRDTDYQQNGPWTSARLNSELDKFMVISQELRAKISRAVRGPFLGNTVAEMPSAADRASKYLWFNASGDPTVVTGDAAQPLTHSVYLVYPTNGQTAVPVPADYTPGAYDLSVYLNGLKQVVGVDYIENSASLITLTNPATLGDVIEFSIGEVFDVTLVRTGREEQSFTGLTTPTITLTTASYTPGAHEVDVFFNGALLATADYTETNSTTITLGFTPVASDQFRVIVGRAVNVTNVSRRQVGAVLYPQTAAEIAAGVTPTDYGYAPGDVRRYGAVGDGTDETQRLQDCYSANAGATVTHEDGKTYLITSGLTLASGTTYKGRAVIKQFNGTNYAGALLLGTTVNNATIDRLEVDGNKANNLTGLTYGIKFTGGSNNRITDSVYVHDTTQAGVWVNDEDNTRSYARSENCGANLGTDNHGVMFTATSGSLTNCRVGGRIKGAYRKGLAVYSATPGAITNILIDRVVASGCGLVGSSGGGIYIANAAATADQDSIVMNGCISTGNYINYEIDNCKRVSGAGNISRGSTGSSGIDLVDSTDVTLTGMVVSDSYVKGVFIDGGTRVIFHGLNVTTSNTSTNAFGPGVHVLDSTYCGAPGATISDDDAKMTHGIIEAGTSDYSNFDGVLANNATSANYTLVGASSYLRVRQTGIVAVASVAALTLPYGFTLFSITGTTNITSIVALGHSGKTVTLVFAGALTFTDGSNLKLAGNFVTTANDVITLTCDGTNWYEVSRSVN